MYASEVSGQLNQGDIFTKISLLDSAAPDSPPVERDVIVLSHDCEIDKPKNRTVLVAAVILLSNLEQVNPGITGDIQRGKAYNAMYLMPQGPLEESCVDFRYIFRVAKQSLIDKVEQGTRVVSLTEDSKKVLCVFFERYLFRNFPAEQDLPVIEGQQLPQLPSGPSQ